MDYFKNAPSDAIERECAICVMPVAPGDPMFFTADKADDTGQSVRVEHEDCHTAVELARACAYDDAANALLRGEAGAAEVLRSRAKRIREGLERAKRTAAA